MKPVLIFGGTAEGRLLAEAALEAGRPVIICVATDVGASFLPAGAPGLTISQGRLDVPEMEALMEGADFAFVLDATHPYAVVVSQNLRLAAQNRALAYYRLLRETGDYEGCLVAPSVAEACRLVLPGNVLAATGSKEIAAYTVISDFQSRVYARVLPAPASVESCLAAGLPQDHILAATGPFSVDENVETLHRLAIKTLITKDGGVRGGFGEKLEAARLCGVRLIVVGRPAEPEGLGFDAALTMLKEEAPCK